MNFIFRGIMGCVDRIKIIAERLREARIAKRMTQEEVGRRIGLGQVGYGAFERGETLPSIEYLIALTTVFDRPLGYLVGLPTWQIEDKCPVTIEVVEILEGLDPDGRQEVLSHAKYVRYERSQHDPQ